MTTTKPPVLTDELDPRLIGWLRARQDWPHVLLDQGGVRQVIAVLERAGADAVRDGQFTIHGTNADGSFIRHNCESAGIDVPGNIVQAEDAKPVAWLTRCVKGLNTGLIEMVDGEDDVTNREYWSAPFPVFAAAIRALKGTPAAAVAETERCTYCDGTGDVHGFDGEWRGVCTECDAGKQLSGNPGQVADAQPVAWMDPDETCVQDAFLWRTSPQTARYRIPVFTAQPSAQPQPSGNAGEVEALATQIKDDLQCQFDTDGITEIDSGDALIRLSEALNAVDEAAIAASKGANHG